MGFRFQGKSGGWGAAAGAAAVPVLLAWLSASPLPSGASARAEGGASAPNRAELERRFNTIVRPFLRDYCAPCHGKVGPQAQLDLTRYADLAAVVGDLPHWTLAMERMRANEMPPATFKQPPAKQRDAVMAWIRDARTYEALRNAGDPGPVLARRLSNAEYDYTIRDLTGADLRPTREFPVDPANQEGFDNSGESLTISPALLKKYVQAAKTVADSAALTSTGIEFAAHPVVAETDRDKFCVLRIVDFYYKQPTEIADYLTAAWRYRHRATLGQPLATLESVATDAGISVPYLKTVWETLHEPGYAVGPVATLQARFRAIPAPGQASPDAIRAELYGLRDWIKALRQKVAWKFRNLKVPPGFAPGGQCFVLWKDRQYAAHRRKFNPDGLQIGGIPKTRVIPARRENGKLIPEQTVTDPVERDRYAPADEAERAPYLASFERFCSVFPDTFYVSERGLMHDDNSKEKGRLLSAGLHNAMGYFRDDDPLMELILDDAGRRRLDTLWRDFDMVAFMPERMHLEFFFYERAESGTIKDPEFNFAKSEDKGALSDEKIKLMADLYAAKAKRNGADERTLAAIEEHFPRVSANIRRAERERIAAEPRHREALLDFARRAYRRPLTGAERADLLGFYHDLREKDGLTHEDAIRDCLTRVLMSPNFLFRLDLEADAETTTPAPVKVASVRPSGGASLPLPRHPSEWVPGSPKRRGGEENGGPLPPTGASPTLFSPPLRFGEPGTHSDGWRGRGKDAPPDGGQSAEPLPAYALASRLSYFLWASMPDDELLKCAADGSLKRPDVLTAQTRRMLKDPRVRALALEFGGNWLDYRRFDEHNAVDRDRFPAFTNDLRAALQEEPIRYFADTFQNNRSVLDLVYGRHTFVNATLARHYGMKDVPVSRRGWTRVENADRYGRGGLLPMAVFLTKNSPGLRTSPVKRGYWVVKRLLGENIPPPPAVVPDLPADESKLGDLTLRQALERHRNNPACSGCHARFDSYGLVFEGYGPVGEVRAKDLGGKPVDTRAPFPTGERAALAGLRDLIRQRRQDDFLDTLTRKLLSYALGRSLQPSDDPLLAEAKSRLAADGYRFNALVETIVTSRQFRYRRATKPSATPAKTAALTTTRRKP